jgi:hypothetical protein
VKIPPQVQLGLVLGGLAIVGVLLLQRYGKGLGKAVGEGAVGLVDGVVSGTVTSAGKVLGIPETDRARCDAAIKAGDGWAASLYCPAGEYLQYVAGLHPLQKTPRLPYPIAPGGITIDQLEAARSATAAPVNTGSGGIVTPIDPKQVSSKPSRSGITLVPELKGPTFAEQSINRSKGMTIDQLNDARQITAAPVNTGSRGIVTPVDPKQVNSKPSRSGITLVPEIKGGTFAQQSINPYSW